jgi:hypothetical protein
MYALSLPTIAQVSPAARFRGKHPIWCAVERRLVDMVMPVVSIAGERAE